MRWSDRRADEEAADGLLWLFVFLGVYAIAGLLVISVVQAQTFYSTEDGTGFAIEIQPGVTYFAGPRSGFAIETMPGVTRYDLHDADLNSTRGTVYDLRPTVTQPERVVVPTWERPRSTERESVLNSRPWWER